MNTTQTLLVELHTEELPPKALAKLGDAFANGIAQGLKSRDFLADGAAVTSYATPRRLAVSITCVRGMSPDKAIREKVLPVSVALDAQGQPTAPLGKKLAALAAAHKLPEISPSALERAQDGKAESFFYTFTAPGAPLAAGVQAALEEAVSKLPIPKVMSYQRPDGETVQFVRPVHKLIALHGNDVLPVSLLGLTAGRETLGHRFLAPGVVTIPHADSYAEALKSGGRIIASVSDRKEAIRAGLLAKANGDQVLMPESLLDEVAALVEWPAVYECRFEEEFLAVPQECLILTMQTNQKYFAVTDAAGKLRNRFLIVSNIETNEPRHIIGGNERVVRPRLSDAKFFFEQDQKKPLGSRLPQLANVVYHNKLGSQLERMRRVKEIAGAVAHATGADVWQAERAAEIAKADLLTDMVGEFPELQGIMGTYYARHDREDEQVALAISEHYQPRFAGDALPSTVTGTIVALADKLETLVGIWGIGLQPTGEKDPFALRRHALGILRILVEKNLPLMLPQLLEMAHARFDGNANYKNPTEEVLGFMYDRLRGLLRDRGYSSAEVEAVVAMEPEFLGDLVARLQAVHAFAELPAAESLAAANKRITNILKKTTVSHADVNPALLREPAEQALHAAIERIEPEVNRAFATRDFAGTLATLAQVRDQVDAFFNDVMVMAEDQALRENRLALLARLHFLMNQVADISKLAA